MKENIMQCPCNPNNDFAACCQPIIRGEQPAQTAEQLMRSRYSAYVIADVNYLMNSHHPRTRPSKERKSILQWAKSVQWVKLEVVSSKDGNENDTTGFVEFKAYYMDKGQLDCIHENSYFVKLNGKWFYKDGEHR